MKQRTRRVGLLVVMIAAASLVEAQSLEDGLVAWYKMEDGKGAVLRDSALGNHGSIVGGVWVTGDRGCALDFDGRTNFVDCGDPAETRLSDTSLTVSLWVCSNERRQQYLLTRFGWSLYLDAAGRAHLETRNSDNTGWGDWCAPEPIRVGEWAHIAATYDIEAGLVCLYVDGKLRCQSTRSGGFGGLFRSRLFLGCWPVATHCFNGLMRDVRIYRRALSAEEVAALYEEGRQAQDPTVVPPPVRVSIRPHLFSASHSIAADLYLRNLGSALAQPGFVVELARAGGQPLQTQRAELRPDGRAEVVFGTAGLEPGEYQLRARVTDGGEPVAGLVAITPLTLKPEKAYWWVGSQEGRTDAVLAPWEPVQVRETGGDIQVACWGRRYVFSHARAGVPFPTEIQTAGASILAGPIRVKVATDDAGLRWAEGEVTIRAATPHKAILEMIVPGEGLHLQGEVSVEYDGMMLVDWRLVPRERVQVRELVVEIPLKAQHAKYLYYYPDLSGSWEAHRPGALLPPGKTMGFNPMLWLGDEDRGLQWFAESDRNWFPAEPECAIEIERAGEGAQSVTLRLNLVGRPMELEPGGASKGPGPLGALDYQFGLQATPVRPVGKDAWDHRTAVVYTGVYEMDDVGPEGRCRLDDLADFGVRTLALMDWTDILCYNQPTRPEDLRRLVEACHQRGIQVLVYFGFQVSDAAPEFATYLEDAANWASGQPYSYQAGLDNYPPKPTQTVYRVCYRSLWADFVVAGTARLMDEYGIDGVYLDGTGCPVWCANTHHGCGYVDLTGALRPTCTHLAARDIMRRLYAVVKGRNPDGQVNLHNSSFLPAFSMGFATSVWDGEQLSASSDMHPLDRLPLDMFRTEFMGRQFGVASEFLDYCLPGTFEQKVGLCLLHDVPVRPYVRDDQLAAVSRLWRLMDEFGRGEAEWLPYWSNAEYARVNPSGTEGQPAACVSLYRHPANGVLAVVVNCGRDPAEVRLELDLGRLGLPEGAVAMDALSSEVLPMEAGAVTLPAMESLGYRVVWVRGE